MALPPDLARLIDDHVQKSIHPLIVILGPTASGKTDISIALAEHLGNAEIINTDSRQLFRAMNIGTAKITEAEKKGIPHHLLDIVEPNETVNASWYQKEARRLIDEIRARNHLPLLVGGSMLYISAVVDGLAFAEPASQELRAELMKLYDQDGGETLMRELQSMDPQSASGIPRENRHRLIRAVEVTRTTGSASASMRNKSSTGDDTLIIGITRDRDELKARIANRAKKMLASGWIEEVRSLKERGYKVTDPGMMSSGYPEIFEALSSPLTDEVLQKLEEVITTKTSQYAKRQMTWWKRDSRIHWITLHSV